MRAGQQPRLEGFLTPRQCTLQVERTDQPVLGRAEWQVDHRHWNEGGAGAAAAHGAAHARVAIVFAARDHGHVGQQLRQRAHGGGFAGAAVAQGEDAAHHRLDGGQQQGKLHLLLPDDRGEGEDRLSGQDPGCRTAIHHAARCRLRLGQISASAAIRWSMSASLCSGLGVKRSRSVPRGTVG